MSRKLARIVEQLEGFASVLDHEELGEYVEQAIELLENVEETLSAAGM